MIDTSMEDNVFFKAVHDDYSAYQEQQGMWKPGTTVEAERPVLSVGDRPFDVPYIKVPGRLVVVEKVDGVELKDFHKINEHHLFTATSWNVIDEKPFWNVFGSNGEAVLSIVNKAPHIDEISEGELQKYRKSNVQHIEAARKSALAGIKKLSVSRPYYFILRELRGYASLAALVEMMKDEIKPEEYEVVLSAWNSQT